MRSWQNPGPRSWIPVSCGPGKPSSIPRGRTTTVQGRTGAYGSDNPKNVGNFMFSNNGLLLLSRTFAPTSVEFSAWDFRSNNSTSGLSILLFGNHNILINPAAQALPGGRMVCSRARDASPLPLGIAGCHSPAPATV